MKRLVLVLLTACGVEATEPSLGAPLEPVTVEPQPQPQPPQAPLTGFPCNVRAVLETNCASCHLGQTYAPTLATRDDLLQPFGDNTTYGARAVTMMSQNQMPPAAATTRPSAQDRETVAAWVSAGMPGGACGPLVAP